MKLDAETMRTALNMVLLQVIKEGATGDDLIKFMRTRTCETHTRKVYEEITTLKKGA